MISLGSILVGIAITAVVVAYVSQPFRHAHADLDKTIEAWVQEAHIEHPPTPASVPPHAPRTLSTDNEPINFCPQCGRKLEADHVFCPGCGNKVPK